MHDNSHLRSLSLILVVNLFLGSMNVWTLQKDQELVLHTQEVRTVLEECLRLNIDSEVGGRGFAITGEEDFLSPYQEAASLLPIRLATLQQLTVDNRIQAVQVPIFKQKIGESNEVIRKIVKAKRENNSADVLGYTALGKKKMDEVRSSAGLIRGEEDRLMRIRTEKLKTSYGWMVVNLLCFTSLVICLLLGLAARRKSIEELAKIARGQYE